jgi:hypothetical protein
VWQWTKVRFNKNMSRLTSAATNQNFSSGFATSQPVKPGSGTDKIFCALEMSRDVSGARGWPGKSLAELAVSQSQAEFPQPDLCP